MNAQERYQLWLNSPDIDEKTKEELRAIANDPQEIEERFYMELEFGTAGLRGILGAGDNRNGKGRPLGKALFGSSLTEKVTEIEHEHERKAKR